MTPLLLHHITTHLNAVVDILDTTLLRVKTLVVPLFAYDFKHMRYYSKPIQQYIRIATQTLITK